MKFQYIKLTENAKAPEKSPCKIGTNAGYDLRYSGTETVKLEPGERFLFPTGLILVFPEGIHGIIKPRSGLALKNGIDVLAGVIDNSYTSETKIILINLSSNTYTVEPGDKIAQILLIKDETYEVEETTVEKLQNTGRGDGFGSTGR